MSRTKGTVDEQQYSASLQEIADHFGVSRERARQLVNEALNKLRKSGNLQAFQDLVSK